MNVCPGILPNKVLDINFFRLSLFYNVLPKSPFSKLANVTYKTTKSGGYTNNYDQSSIK